jgi:hypothetical protein
MHAMYEPAGAINASRQWSHASTSYWNAAAHPCSRFQLHSRPHSTVCRAAPVEEVEVGWFWTIGQKGAGSTQAVLRRARVKAKK